MIQRTHMGFLVPTDLSYLGPQQWTLLRITLPVLMGYMSGWRFWCACPLLCWGLCCLGCVWWWAMWQLSVLFKAGKIGKIQCLNGDVGSCGSPVFAPVASSSLLGIIYLTCFNNFFILFFLVEKVVIFSCFKLYVYLVLPQIGCLVWFVIRLSRESRAIVIFFYRFEGHVQKRMRLWFIGKSGILGFHVYFGGKKIIAPKSSFSFLEGGNGKKILCFFFPKKCEKDRKELFVSGTSFSMLCTLCKLFWDVKNVLKFQ